MRLELAQEDNSAHAEGNVSLHEVTPAGMLIEMLEIEDQQYVSTSICVMLN